MGWKKKRANDPPQEKGEVMPAKIEMTTIVLLWEHELRIAAKALHKLKDENATQADFQNAIKACWAALYHPSLVDDKNPVTIMSAHQPKKNREKK